MHRKRNERKQLEPFAIRSRKFSARGSRRDKSALITWYFYHGGYKCNGVIRVTWEIESWAGSLVAKVGVGVSVGVSNGATKSDASWRPAEHAAEFKSRATEI
jgi:hypothetical protein